MSKNKKAQIGEITQDFTAFIIVFILVVLFFLLSLLFTSANNKIIKQDATKIQDSVRADVAITTLLEKEVNISIDNEIQKLSIAELIMLSKISNQHEDKIKELKNLLENKDLCKNSRNCYFEIKEGEKCPESEKKRKYSSCIILPSTNNLIITLVNVY
ncbi:MAG: hypothetical protein QXP53_01525 [Candidatus Pacearchaeota archaeon]